MVKLGAIAAAAFLLSASVVQAQTFKQGQVWINQSQSVLTISAVGADGALKGTYTNNNQNFDCKGTPFEVSGWVFGDLIAFQVRWKNATQDCNSIASWVGSGQSGTATTNWDLVYIDASTHKPTHATGQDTFQVK